MASKQWVKSWTCDHFLFKSRPCGKDIDVEIDRLIREVFDEYNTFVCISPKTLRMRIDDCHAKSVDFQDQLQCLLKHLGLEIKETVPADRRKYICIKCKPGKE